MSMRGCPDGGYIMPLEEYLKVVLPGDAETRTRIMDRLNEDYDHETAMEAITRAVPHDALLPLNVVRFSEDNGDEIQGDLEFDTVYVLFDEQALYRKQLTPEAEDFERAAGKPLDTLIFRSEWSIFG